MKAERIVIEGREQKLFEIYSEYRTNKTDDRFPSRPCYRLQCFYKCFMCYDLLVTRKKKIFSITSGNEGL